jgi:hypothetical protein
MATTMGIEQLPDHLLLANVCGFVHLQDRWHGLARVSKRWRKLTVASVHREQHVDLVRMVRCKATQNYRH